MTMDEDDKKFVNDVAEAVVKELKPAPSDEGGDFLMHLYDALWENMRSKENRLWTFLSLYGAAVGLVFAGGQVSQVRGADLFAIVIVMALTTWAVLIILNTIWWSARNQLMVSRIEVKYPRAIKGIVPRIYNKDPQFRSEQLSERSILLLTLLLLFLYSRTLWSYHNGGSVNDVQSLAVVILLYLSFIFSAGFCLGLNESNIGAYYRAKTDILDDAARDASNEQLPSALPGKVRLEHIEAHIKTRQKLDVRIQVLLLLCLVALLFDFIVYRNGSGSFWLTMILLLQLLAAVVFLTQRRFYCEPFSKQDWKSIEDLKGEATPTQETAKRIAEFEGEMGIYKKGTWPLMAFVVVTSAAFAIVPLYKSSQRLQQDWKGAVTDTATDVEQKITKTEEDLKITQKAFNELQQSNVQVQRQLLDEKLAPYTKRKEADQQFVTRDEFNKFIQSPVKTK